MPIYKLCAVVTVSAHTEVEADTPEAALAIAAKRDVEIGGITSGNYPDEVWLIEDADGVPYDIRFDDEEGKTDKAGEQG